MSVELSVALSVALSPLIGAIGAQAGFWWGYGALSSAAFRWVLVSLFVYVMFLAVFVAPGSAAGIAIALTILMPSGGFMGNKMK